MSWMRPATPGFVVTFVSTLLLLFVLFGVPYIKSIFFLKASISQGGVNGSITIGTLGYCLELSNGTACSQASFKGYELDINSLVGSNLQFPQVLPKWITAALLVHVFALLAAAGSALFGLLAHVREMSMACCSTCFSTIAATIAFIAFLFDVILFFVAKAKIRSVGSAQIGSATWLTLSAFLLLFFSGIFYSCGRRCINDRPPKKRRKDKRQSEVGLPEFSEIQPLKVSEPLNTVPQPSQATHSSQTADLEIRGDIVHMNDQPQTYHQQSPSGGYVPVAPGSSAMDDFYRIGNTQNTYPPQPQRRPSQPSHAPPVTYPDDPTVYGPYGYATPSPIPPDGLSYFSATDPRQGLNYPQYNPSPSPHQDPYNPYSLPNQIPSYPYANAPLSPQASHQRRQGNYIPGRVDQGPNYPQYNPPMPSASYPFTVPNQSAHGIPSHSLQESHQPRQGNYIPGGVDQGLNYNHNPNPYDENRRSPSPSDNEALSLLNTPPPLQPSSSPQESHQTRQAYPPPPSSSSPQGSHQTKQAYPPPPPPLPSSSPQESHQTRQGNYVHERVDHDLPPPDYTF